MRGYALVSQAEPGAALDFSNVKTGDIVGFGTSFDAYVHVALWCGDALWEQNEWDSGVNAGKKGTQPVDLTDTTLEMYRSDDYRRIVRPIVAMEE